MDDLVGEVLMGEAEVQREVAAKMMLDQNWLLWTSPQSSNNLNEGDRTAQKHLVSSDGSMNVRGQTLPNLVGKVAGIIMLLEGASASTTNDLAATPGKVPVVKRRWQDGRLDVEDMQHEEVASLEEDR